MLFGDRCCIDHPALIYFATISPVAKQCIAKNAAAVTFLLNCVLGLWRKTYE